MRALAILTVLLLAPLTDAITQEPPLTPGQRVRVTVPNLDLNKHEETFHQVRSDTLVLESLWCPLSDVTRLDVYAGRKSHFGLGLVIGAAVGGAAGAVIFGREDACFTHGEGCAGFGLAVGAASGALIGGLIGGLAWKTDKWEEVPLDRLRVSVVPQRGGFAFAASVRF